MREVGKQRAKFVAACISLATANLEKDPGLARRAATAALAVAPGDGTVLALIAKAGPIQGLVPGMTRSTLHVPDWVETWRDVLGEGLYGTVPEGKTLLIEDTSSSFERPQGSIETGSRYVIEIDIRKRKSVGKGATMVGVEFGHLSAFVSGGLLVIDESIDGKTQILGQADVVTSEAGGWFRLALVIEDGRVSVWLGGRPELRRIKPRSYDLGGTVSIFHANCSAEVRHLRIGVPQ